jgi:C-terminal processing protease CtpA/Prc
MEERIARLESLVARQVALGSELAAKIDGLETEVAALREREQASPAAAAAPQSNDAVPTPRDQIDYSKSAMQRALEAAGLDEQTAESIKLRGDQLAMTEMYLRDQATREGWLDTPRFREEMAAIEAQRTSIREELGDEAYDRYLFALGRTNRVIVNDVMYDSVAEDVGLQTGDLIIRYGDSRVFATDELVTQTREGSVGDPVTVVISRGGKRMEIEVPRGPLGVRVGVTQDNPDAS